MINQSAEMPFFVNRSQPIISMGPDLIRQEQISCSRGRALGFYGP